MDSLYLSYQGQLDRHVAAMLQELKDAAQSFDEHTQAKAGYRESHALLIGARLAIGNQVVPIVKHARIGVHATVVGGAGVPVSAQVVGAMVSLTGAGFQSAIKLSIAQRDGIGGGAAGVCS